MWFHVCIPLQEVIRPRFSDKHRLSAWTPPRADKHDGLPLKRCPGMVPQLRLLPEGENHRPLGKMTTGSGIPGGAYGAKGHGARRGYIYIDHHLKPEVGNILLVDLRPHHVRKMLANLAQKKKPAKDPAKAQPYQPSTISQIYTGFRAAMNQAVSDDLLRKSPCLKIPGPEVVHQKPTYCTAEQVQAVIQRMEGTRFFMPIYLCIMLGIRRGEALGLKWEISRAAPSISASRLLPSLNLTAKKQSEH